MNSKTVLQKLVALLKKEEVTLTYAKLADGTIVESETFDVGEDLFVVSEDGVKSPAPNGTHELALKDESGNENLIKVKTEDGKIVERENVELEDVKVEDIPQAGNEDKENVMDTPKGSVESGTFKGAEQTDIVSEDMPETDGKPLGEVESEDEGPEVEIELGKKIEKMAYRIAELEKKIAKMEEAIVPPVDSQVTEEVADVKMEEEELPKLDGAPVEEVKMSSINNKNVYGKKIVDSQSAFLSKLYK
jgi:hypothetical protein